eukprot:TRINITY_DN61024_c0_g1_i1.p1 TRINITY_DN61024_c0_g1~~TRINITY_DN61024_c0_g1_i1.p1  ORF type:complete len:539 (-),score=126.09 TRINITY_DN61024_c0_g1_i1:78-1616(-)
MAEYADYAALAQQLEGVLDERLEGVVAQWSERGYGFVHFPDGRRAYVHNSQSGGVHLHVGESVSALVVQDEKNPGKLQALQVQRLNPGVAAAGVDPGHTDALLAAIRSAVPKPSTAVDLASYLDTVGGRQDAVVQEWNERGFGFLELADGRRAYVHNSHCGGEHLTKGETVSAVITVDSKNAGKLAAQSVLRVATHAPHVLSDDLLGGEDGVVTEWREDGGFGFMLMDDARRVYVHRSHLGGSGSLIVGQRLRVITRPDARNPGKWCVAQVKAEIAQAPASPALPGSVAVTATRPSLGGGSFSPEEEADGTVTEWREEGGFGFLSMDDGRRIYIHRNFFGGAGSLVIGQRLRVTTKPDPRNPGKWSVDQVKGELQDATSATLEAAAAAAAAGVTGTAGNSWDQLFGPGAYAAAMSASQEVVSEVQEGIVAEWHEEGGYGFLTMDDGRRVYIHRHTFGGAGSLLPGSRLQVTTKPDMRNPGKWSVDQVIAGDVAVLSNSPVGSSPASKRPRVL